MQNKSLIIILIIFSCRLGFAQETKKSEVISFASLLREMSNPEKLARWPESEWKNLQSSALKTDKRNNPGYFGTKEIGNFVRIEDKGNGKREWVLMEHQGPGAIIRMWAPNMAKDATFRIYLDGNEKPSMEVNMMKLFYGEEFVPPPFAALKARGGNVYLPIPFAQHCKVTVDKNECGWAEPADLFYIIQYRAYAPGTGVKTFDLGQFEENKSLLNEVGGILKNPVVKMNDFRQLADTILNAGQKIELELKSGSLAINFLSATVEARDMAEALRSTKVKLEFDGAETVDCPIGDFFGSGLGLNPFKDWIRTVEKGGKLTCRWVMPYEKSAKLKIENNSKLPIKFKIDINYQPWKWDEQSMYFHANWGYDRGINNLPIPNFNFINIKGKGTYVGETLSITNYSPRWWGEGMEKITVDNEAFPSQFGTGSEDYYGYAWGDPSIFDAPFHVQPRVPEGPDFYGTTVNTRIRSLDAIPFKESLNLDLEILTQGAMINEFAELDCGVATFWYGFKNTAGTWKYDAARMGK